MPNRKLVDLIFIHIRSTERESKNRKWYKSPRPTNPGDMLPSARLRKSHNSADNITNWDHMFKFMSLWDTLLIQATHFAHVTSHSC